MGDKVGADDVADLGACDVVGEVGAIPDDDVLAGHRLAVFELADVDTGVRSGFVVDLAGVPVEDPDVADRVGVAGRGVVVCPRDDVVGGARGRGRADTEEALQQRR